jgi:hypothetical protein
MRIVGCSPKPIDDLVVLYDVALELVGPGEPSCECVAGDTGVLSTGPQSCTVRDLWIGPLHVPANCSLTIDSYEWVGYAHVWPGPSPLFGNWQDSVRVSLPVSALALTLILGADIGHRAAGIWGAAAGNEINTDGGNGPVMTSGQWAEGLAGGTPSGEVFVNDTAADIEIFWYCGANPSYGDSGDWTITINYHCGPADTIVDLGPQPGATTTHTVDPTVTDDYAHGYTVGSVWINTTDGGVFVLVDSTTGAAVWVSVTDFAPTGVDYLVGTASSALSAEIVVGTTPGGELGGTWASPTVDATHSGSAHLALGTTGSTAAAGNHGHAAYRGELLISDTPSNPLIFADLVQNDAGTDLLYADP